MSEKAADNLELLSNLSCFLPSANEDMIKKQIYVVGAEPLFDRLDESLEELRIEPLFVREQWDLYNGGSSFLRNISLKVYISNIYLTETYNTKDRFRLIVRLDYIIDVYMTNVGRRFGFFLLLTDVYSVITDLFDHCCFNILELGNCHKIPPHSKHSPPNHIHLPMCPPGRLFKSPRMLGNILDRTRHGILYISSA